MLSFEKSAVLRSERGLVGSERAQVEFMGALTGARPRFTYRGAVDK